MKKAFIITSSIDVDNSNPLNYSQVRSYFSNEERLRHTVFTVASLDMLGDKDTTIYVLDNSNSNNYDHYFGYQKNLKFINVKNDLPHIFHEVTTHRQKSRCECLMLSEFLKKYTDELAQYDFIFKLSGRYFLDSSFNMSLLTEENLDKIFFKKPLIFEWNEAWGMHFIDRRVEQGDNTLRQYSSVIYGWGKKQHSNILWMLDKIAEDVTDPVKEYADVELLSYYYTRQWQHNLIETDWLVYGWTGVNGNFVRY